MVLVDLRWFCGVCVFAVGLLWVTVLVGLLVSVEFAVLG